MRRGQVLLSTLCVLAAGAAVAAAPASVELELTPRAPVKGVDVEATLLITLGGDARQPPPVLRANVGTLEAVERVGPGAFRARYLLPTTRFPEVAIIVAFAPWPHPQAVEGAVGVLRVPLASAVEVPGKAEPGARVTLTLAGKTFGAVEAGSDGTFRLPAVVPPGFGVAQATTVDRARNRRTAPLDLRLPPTDQLACVVTPTRLPADGSAQARVLCATSDRYGGVARGAKVQWKPEAGTLSAAVELGDGVTEWRWTAPRELRAGAAKLIATWKQGPVDSKETLTVELSQGPVVALALTGEELAAHRGASWSVRAVVRDGLGRPLPGVRLEAEGLTGAVSDAQGEGTLRWTVPLAEALGPRAVTIVASGPGGREPAQLLTWSVPGGLGVAAVDLSGLPVAGERVLVGDREGVTGLDGTVVVAGGSGAARSAEWSGLVSSPLAPDAGVASPRLGVRAEVRVTVAPALPVNVRLERVGDGARWWLEAPSGELLDGREVEVRTSAGTRRAVSRARTAELVRDGVLVVTDVATRVSAVLEGAP